MGSRRKIQFQVPFFIQEALRVAQATAVKSMALADPDNQPEAGGEHISTPAPMTVKAKTVFPESQDGAENFKAYGKAEVFFHFNGGLSVKVWLTSYLSDFGQHWAVSEVQSRYYVCRGGRQGDKKSVTTWKGEELDRLARAWGNEPCRWRDDR